MFKFLSYPYVKCLKLIKFLNLYKLLILHLCYYNRESVSVTLGKSLCHGVPKTTPRPGNSPGGRMGLSVWLLSWPRSVLLKTYKEKSAEKFRAQIWGIVRHEYPRALLLEVTQDVLIPPGMIANIMCEGLPTRGAHWRLSVHSFDGGLDT